MKKNLIRNNEEDHILLYGEREIVYLMLKDILYIEAHGNYSIFHMRNEKKFVSCHKLKYYEELLEEANFFRISRSYIVNKACIKYYHTDTRELILTNSFIAFVSFRRRKLFLNSIYKSNHTAKAMVG
ncbi:LytR/AlgR family response regulator transcription factor [Kordia sp.]|uniref:LytR/AlgR family response regulator transcription factor n=1 Tax=Kordia sp. TaxID=1965332 RepID=UPI003B59CEA6